MREREREEIKRETLEGELTFIIFLIIKYTLLIRLQTWS